MTPSGWARPPCVAHPIREISKRSNLEFVGLAPQMWAGRARLAEMPLYIVRGPATWGALIRARDLDHLYYLIDEVADPGTCAVSEYTGPVALEFQLRPRSGSRRPWVMQRTRFCGL